MKNILFVVVIMVVLAGLGGAWWWVQNNAQPVPDAPVSDAATPEGTPAPSDKITVLTTDDNSLLDVVAKRDNTAEFIALVTQAGLIPALEGEEVYTLFVPVDAAFQALTPELRERYFAPENVAYARVAVTYPLIADKFAFGDSVPAEGKKVVSILGAPLVLKSVNGDNFVGEAKVVEGPLVARNGFVYLIDQVIEPDDLGPMGLKPRR